MLEDISELEDIEHRLTFDISHTLESLKELNNEYQTLIGSIRVNVRIRPTLRSITSPSLGQTHRQERPVHPLHLQDRDAPRRPR